MLANGKRKQDPLTEDKASLLALLKRLQREQDDKRAAGVSRQDEQRERPVDDLVDAYASYLATMTFTLSAAVSKNRKTSTLPLSPALADKLKPWFATLERDALFPGRWVKGGFGGRMLKRDLKRAGIAYVDEHGRFADFHALRTTFITSLAKAVGTGLKASAFSGWLPASGSYGNSINTRPSCGSS